MIDLRSIFWKKQADAAKNGSYGQGWEWGEV